MSRLFPNEERFDLTSQINRSSASISANIAEGSGRQSPKEKARYTEMAYSSALELLNQLIYSLDLEYVSHENYLFIRNDIEEVTLMLDALYKSQLKNIV